MRFDLELAQKIIIVTAILENMARLWGEEDIEEDEADEHDGNDDVVVHDNAQNTARTT